MKEIEDNNRESAGAEEIERDREHPENSGQEFAGKLLAKIKGDRMIPKPRWHFLLKNYVVWAAGFLSLLVGALAVSVLIYLVGDSDIGVYQETKKSFGEYVLLTLPYLWIVFLGIFVFIVYYNFKHSGRGYRYPSLLLAATSIILSIILGTVFYSLGFGEKVDDILGEAPMYDRLINPRVDFWSHPDDGRISGLVAAKVGQGFVIVDRNHEEWLLVSAGNYDVSPLVGQPIMAVGREAGDHVFVVEHFLSPGSGRGFFDRFKGPRPRRFDSPDTAPVRIEVLQGESLEN